MFQCGDLVFQLIVLNSHVEVLLVGLAELVEQLVIVLLQVIHFLRVYLCHGAALVRDVSLQCMVEARGSRRF